MIVPKTEKAEIVRVFCQGVEEITRIDSIEDLITIISIIAQANKQAGIISDKTQ